MYCFIDITIYQYIKITHFLLLTISLKFFTKLFYCPNARTLCSMSLNFYWDYSNFCNFYSNFCYFSI